MDMDRNSEEETKDGPAKSEDSLVDKMQALALDENKSNASAKKKNRRKKKAEPPQNENSVATRTRGRIKDFI